MVTATPDATALSTLISALRRFNQFDGKMQVSTILTLLEIALAEAKNEDISVQDIEKRVGLMSGTASRNVYYWGEGHKDMRARTKWSTSGSTRVTAGSVPCE